MCIVSKEIIDNVKVYHYIYATSSKTIALSSDNSLSETKSKTIEKIKSKIDIFHNKNIIRIKLKKIPKEIYQKSKVSKLTGIGGPIVADITVYKVSKTGNLRIENNEDRNNTVYFSEEY